MIKSITVTNHLNESIKLELGFPERSGFLIQEISGLGPVKADINVSELSSVDGSIYNSARMSSRNIVFNLALLESPMIEDARQKSYKYFPVKKRIRLLIETTNRTAEIFGYVESNEPIIFSRQETTQISIVCPNPYFYSAGPKGKQITGFSGFEKVFSFPFSNEALSDKLLIIGNIIKNQIQTVLYDGDSEIGFNIEIHSVGTAEHVRIYNVDTLENMKIDTDKLIALTGQPIIIGDSIFISTIKGDKSIQLLREGVYYNIINCLDRDVTWMFLRKGDNVFAFDAEEGGANLYFRIINQVIYQGI
ncbi:MAG: phage tail family protein [Bacteroidales bacterium]|nr:phage tail family protein [Bacteroidales bacterium]